MAKSKKEHYVNNKEFLEALIDYKADCDAHKGRVSKYRL